MSLNNAPYNSMNDSTLIQQKACAYKLRSMKDDKEYLLDQVEILVGREVECQISLGSGHISRYHAKLTIMPNEVVIEDLRSTNGTFINGRRITSPQTAHIGDEIRFHELAFRLVSTEEESGHQEATVFQQAVLEPPVSKPVQSEVPPQPAQPSSDQQPANEPVASPAPSSHDDADSTRILSIDDLNRLQGKAERSTSASVDSGSGPRMVVLTAPIRGKIYSLISRKKNAWLIGRGQDCDFQLQDQTVSSQHARIRKLGDEWILEACEGRNPIFINNRSVEFSTLNPGDVVRVGRMELVFRVDEKALVPEPEDDKVRPSRLNVALLLGALVVLGVVLGVIFS